VNWLAALVGIARRVGTDVTPEEMNALMNVVTVACGGVWPDNFEVSGNMTTENILNAPELFWDRMCDIEYVSVGETVVKKKKKPAATKKAVKSTQPTKSPKASSTSSASSPAKPKTPRKAASPKKAAPTVTEADSVAASAKAKVSYKDIQPFLYALSVYIPAGKDAAATAPETEAWRMDNFFPFVFDAMCKNQEEKDAGLTLRMYDDGFVSVTRARDARLNAYMTKRYCKEGDKPIKGACMLFHTGDTARTMWKPVTRNASWKELMTDMPTDTFTARPSFEAAVSKFGPKKTIKKKKPTALKNVAVPMDLAK